MTLISIQRLLLPTLLIAASTLCLRKTAPFYFFYVNKMLRR